MIKQGVRKCLKTPGTVLLVRKESGGWDKQGHYHSYIVGGDLLYITGNQWSGKLETICVATGQRLWMWRHWLVDNTTLAFDARELATTEDC